MTDPARGALRVARGAVAGVMCTLLAAAGHVLGGGTTPPLSSLVAVGVLATAVFVLRANRRAFLGLVPIAAAPPPASPTPQALPAPYDLLLTRLRGRRGPPLTS